MKGLNSVVRLNSGYSIPLIGFGTYQLRGQDCKEAVTAALDVGYKHIDTAYIYQNERIIGEVLQGRNRSDLFITSKIPPSHQGYDKAIEAASQSLNYLGIDYLDLLLIHWPGSAGMTPTDPRNRELRHETWTALERLQRDGKVRSIGVSNFQVRHLEELLERCVVPPCINQFEFHPLCQNDELIRFCGEKHIQVEAYSSLARGDPELFQSEDVQSIATNHNVSIAQVLLRWGLQKDIIVLPKSKHPERIRTNADLDSFQLTPGEMRILDMLNRAKHTCWESSSVI